MSIENFEVSVIASEPASFPPEGVLISLYVWPLVGEFCRDPTLPGYQALKRAYEPKPLQHGTTLEIMQERGRVLIQLNVRLFSYKGVCRAKESLARLIQDKLQLITTVH